MCGYNINKHGRYHETALVAQLVTDLKVFYVLQYLGGGVLQLQHTIMASTPTWVGDGSCCCCMFLTPPLKTDYRYFLLNWETAGFRLF